ncbi:MAG: hypothetical protein IVW52_19685 [Acidimicrobiales bacterium]|nr:hypothetical protein [Acidimicrobiales bacterium]
MTGSTLPSLASAFAFDNNSFQSAASSTQQALNQLPATASAQQVSQQVQPLLAAANMFQSDVVNLQWSAAMKPKVQSLLNSVGQVSAILNESQRATGFTSVSQFRSQLKSALGTVKSASAYVSAGG